MLSCWARTHILIYFQCQNYSCLARMRSTQAFVFLKTPQINPDEESYLEMGYLSPFLFEITFHTVKQVFQLICISEVRLCIRSLEREQVIAAAERMSRMPGISAAQGQKYAWDETSLSFVTLQPMQRMKIGLLAPFIPLVEFSSSQYKGVYAHLFWVLGGNSELIVPFALTDLIQPQSFRVGSVLLRQDCHYIFNAMLI